MSNMVSMDKVVNKISEIAKVISEAVVNGQLDKNFSGLYGDSFGALMFLLYYKKIINSTRYDDLIEKILDEKCDIVSNGYSYPAFATGVSGILYGLEFIRSEFLIDIDLSEIKREYIPYLKKEALFSLKRGEFDILHKSLGIAYYIIEYDDNRDLEFIDSLLRYLLITSERRPNNQLTWKTYLSDSVGYGYGISLAHGVSSIVLFLSKLLENRYSNNLIKPILDGAINYIVSQQIDYSLYGSFFPTFAVETMAEKMYPLSSSRLGWCYGDLGIAYALRKAGVVINNMDIVNLADRILKLTTKRYPKDISSVNDACLCHGTAGIAQIYNRLYLSTGDIDYKLLNDYWINETLNMAKGENSSAGYKFWKGSEKVWQDNLSFLEGTSGIGLSLISSINPFLYSSWDKIILL